MKKLFFSACMLLGVTFASNAQAPLDKGDAQLNAGLGFSGWGTPIYAGVDFGLPLNFTLGIEGSYRSYSQTYWGEKFSSSIFGFQGNANYHLGEILDMNSEWDLYGGLSLNYYIWQTDSQYKDFAQASGFGLGGQAGVRYFFTDSFGVNLEFGAGNVTGGKIGITYKL